MSNKINKIREKLVSIGDDAKSKYDSTKDLKVALLAVKAYGEATKTAMAQVQYKRLTGNMKTIDFLEE